MLRIFQVQHSWPLHDGACLQNSIPHEGCLDWPMLPVMIVQHLNVKECSQCCTVHEDAVNRRLAFTITSRSALKESARANHIIIGICLQEGVRPTPVI